MDQLRDTYVPTSFVPFCENGSTVSVTMANNQSFRVHLVPIAAAIRNDDVPTSALHSGDTCIESRPIPAIITLVITRIRRACKN